MRGCASEDMQDVRLRDRPWSEDLQENAIAAFQKRIQTSLRRFVERLPRRFFGKAAA